MIREHVVFGPNTGGGGNSGPVVKTRFDIDPYTGRLFDASYLHREKPPKPIKPTRSLPKHYDIDPYTGMIIDTGYLHK